MKNILPCVLFLGLTVGFTSCVALPVPRAINVKVIDDLDEPITGASGAAGFTDVGGTVGETDARGTFQHVGKQTGTWYVNFESPDHYRTSGSGPMGWPPIPPPDPLVVVLKRKIEPVPMVVGTAPDYEMPLTDEPVAYDLELADWVAPHGEGKRPDLYFQVLDSEAKRDDYGRARVWSVKVRMWVEGEGNGLMVMEGSPWEDLDLESTLVSIQQAPVDGFRLQEIVQEAEVGYGNRIASIDWYQHHVLFRVRSEVLEDGTVRYANVGKIYYPMLISPGAPEKMTIESLFYFNPDRNSRSLEFNGENLHPTYEQAEVIPY